MRYRIRTLIWGHLGLDGGAMFGVVPKPLWERTNPPDERNRINLAMRGLLVEGQGVVALVDCGAGTKWTPKARDIYDIREAEGGAARVLGRVGLTPEDVTHVVISHLHFDHAGGSTKAVEGRLVPTFPRAKYYVQKRQLEWARQPSVRDRASYFREDFEPLIEAGLLVELDGPREVLPGLAVEVSNGHTPGLQMVRIAGPAGDVVFPSDVMPTSSHVPLPYVMGYDLEPLSTVAEKERLLERAANAGDVIVFEHDPRVAAARFCRGERGFEIAERFADPWEAGVE